MHEEKCGEGRHEALVAKTGPDTEDSCVQGVGQPTAMRLDCFRSWSTLLHPGEKMFEARAKVKGRGRTCIHRMLIPISLMTAPGSPDVPRVLPWVGLPALREP